MDRPLTVVKSVRLAYTLALGGEIGSLWLMHDIMTRLPGVGQSTALTLSIIVALSCAATLGSVATISLTGLAPSVNMMDVRELEYSAIAIMLGGMARAYIGDAIGLRLDLGVAVWVTIGICLYGCARLMARFASTQ